jgi:hypothetical protein
MLGHAEIKLSQVHQAQAWDSKFSNIEAEEIVLYTRFGELSPFRLRLRLLVVTSYASKPISLQVRALKPG